MALELFLLDYLIICLSRLFNFNFQNQMQNLWWFKSAPLPSSSNDDKESALKIITDILKRMFGMMKETYITVEYKQGLQKGKEP